MMHYTHTGEKRIYYLTIMNSNADTIKLFYESFQNLNAESMVSHYGKDVIFSDPAFGQLIGERASNMWKMLLSSQKGKQFEVVPSNIIATDTGGTAHWQATYIFSQTGRKVVNEVDAHFKIVNGKIVAHTASFNLHKWARQAMGIKGMLLGGTNFFKKKLQAQTNKMLDSWDQKQ